MLSGALSLCAALASAQYGAAGLTKSVILPAFNPAARTCTSPPPASLLLNPPQYATVKALTDAAINRRLGGRANVVLLTLDSMQFLAPRFEARCDGLRALPGVTIVADIAL